MVESSRRALYDIAKIDNDLARMQKYKKKRQTKAERNFYNQNFSLLVDIFAVKCIENYLSYISALTKEIYLAKPEALRSEKQVSLEEVLKHKDLNSFIEDWITKKIENLSYYSFNEINDHYMKKFGILLVGKRDYKFLKRCIAFRNCSVHCRGIADERYILEAELPKSQIGKKNYFGRDEAKRLIDVLQKSVLSIDKTAIKEFKLRKRKL